MNPNFAVVVRALTLIGLATIIVIGMHSCMVEDHRHSEEMRRLSSECQE